MWWNNYIVNDDTFNLHNNLLNVNSLLNNDNF